MDIVPEEPGSDQIPLVVVRDVRVLSALLREHTFEDVLNSHLAKLLELMHSSPAAQRQGAGRPRPTRRPRPTPNPRPALAHPVPTAPALPPCAGPARSRRQKRRLTSPSPPSLAPRRASRHQRGTEAAGTAAQRGTARLCKRAEGVGHFSVNF